MFPFMPSENTRMGRHNIFNDADFDIFAEKILC